MFIEFLNAIKSEISGIKAKRYVEGIAQFHRIQASQGYHKAALYVVNELKKFGIEAKIQKFISDGKTKYFDWPSPVGWDIEYGELRIIHPKDMKLADYSITPLSVVVHSNSTPEEGITAEVVYVGKGILPEHYEGKDVKDKFVLATGKASMVHKEAVIKRGAKGIILFDPKKVDVPDAVPYQAIWPVKEELERVGIGFSLSLRDAQKILNYLDKGEKVIAFAKTKTRFYDSNLEVITAEIPGENNKEEIVFIAHLCHPYPGANDNASGSGLLIEIARTLKKLLDKGLIQPLDRTIRFMWVPEMLGTLAFIHRYPKQVENIIAGFNLDMVGEKQSKTKSVLTIIPPPLSLPSFVAAIVEDVMKYVAEAPLKQYGEVSGLPAFRYKITPFLGGSDHYIFVDSNYKKPFVSFTQWPDLYYHSSLDSTENVDPNMLEYIGEIALTSALLIGYKNKTTAIWVLDAIKNFCTMKIKDIERSIVGFILKTEDKSKIIERFPVAQMVLDSITQWAIEAIESTRTIFTDEFFETLILSAIDEISQVATFSKEIIKKIILSKQVSPEECKLTTKEKRLMTMFPVRKFKAPVYYPKLRDEISEEKRIWYINKEDENHSFRTQIDAAINYMTGTYSIYDIYIALNAEYSFNTITLEDLITVIKDLEALGIIEISQKE